jgi:aryl-alcohol dehydrogenase-like predicted oxidoreductase
MNIKKIILGTAQLNSRYGISNFSSKKNKKKEAFSFLEIALDKGVNKIETAPSYNNEKLLGEFLRNYRFSKKINIITKINSIFSSKDKFYKIFKSLNESEKNLNQSIDTILFHDFKDIDFFVKNFKAINTIQKLFHINNIGASIYDLSQLKKIEKIQHKLCIQLPINLINDTFTNYDFKKNLIIHGRSLFSQGLLLNKRIKIKLSTKDKIKHKKYFKYLSLNNLNPLEICLNYFNNKRIHNFVLGFDDKKQLLECLNLKKQNINYNAHIGNIIKIFNKTDLKDPRKWKYTN